MSIERKLRPDEEKSGFRLLSISPFALTTRSTLMSMAHDTIDAQYYEIGNDATGRAFLGDLRDAALRGVRVRLLVDDWGTTGLDQLLLGLETYPNVEIRVFNPFFRGRSSLASRILLAPFDIDRVNRRMHNKLMVVDGVATIFGGRNIADDYFMRSSVSDFIDVELFGLGPVAQQFDETFDLFWNSSVAYPISQVAGLPNAYTRREFERAVAPAEAKAQHLSRPAVDLLGFGALSDELLRGQPDLHWAQATVYADTPEKVIARGSNPGLDTAGIDVMSIAHTAEHRLTLVSPYFVPDETAMDRLAADRIRGVEVNVLTNSLESTDEQAAYAGYVDRRKDLLDLGVGIYEVVPERFRRHWAVGRLKGSAGALHEKAVVVDHTTIALGSLNLDRRSAVLNTEDMAVIFSPELAVELDSLITRVERLGAYRVALDSTKHEEWTDTSSADGETLISEPGDSIWHRFESWLIQQIVPESSM